MKIGIDASVLERTRTGISRYLLNLLKEWNMGDHEHQFILYFKDHIPDDLVFDNQNFQTVLIRAPKLLNRGLIWENILLPLKARKDSLDLFFSPHYTLPLIKPCDRCVVTIFDISFVAHPEWVPMRNRLLQGKLSYFAAHRADRIITGLEFTRREITKYFKVNMAKIVAIPAGVEEKFKADRNPEKGLKLKEKYHLKEKVILSLGLIMQRRHQDAIIKAFQPLSEKYENVSLLIAGPDRTYPPIDIKGLISDLKLRDKVTYVEYIPEDELVDIYNLADLYVYISEYEGEGLPLREAMACGVPLVVSTFFGEIVGDAALVVEDSNSSESVSAALEKALTDQPLRASLVQQGLKLTALNSWKACAKKTLSIFTSLKE